MGKIVAATALSHAFTLLEPELWDELRERNRRGYERRYGAAPPVHPKIAEETLESNRERYQRIKSGIGHLRQIIAAKKPDALILIGDDQNENFRDNDLPQLALYLGNQIVTTERQGSEGYRRGPTYPCHFELANRLLNGLVEREFDVSACKSFPDDELLSHAHGPVMDVLLPARDIPIVLFFVNAIHVPAVTPHRCYKLGAAIRSVIEEQQEPFRVIICASGGLSHFTGGYPWKHYQGPYSYGSINEEFDRKVLDWMARGKGEQLARLSSADLLNNGDIELRSWITLLGAVSGTPAQILAYEPFYRGIMGMGVACWELESS
jgi:aromatic ring-opening dioxygenase catalytic subunit (LigB family)